MGYRYTVLGAGRQGIAIAYDLVMNGEAESLVLVDADTRLAEKAAQRLNMMTKKKVVTVLPGNVTTVKSIKPALEGSDVVVSALPYIFNQAAAEAAITSDAHFCDLGGNTSVVMEELELNKEAKFRGVSLLPDCGLAPGLSNLLAAWAIQQVENPTTVRVRCGGLPKLPRVPLFYKLVFNLDGLINEYSGESIVLRNGQITKIPTLTELEMVDIPGVGKYEAAVTSGGTSTAPYSFQQLIENFDYKTLRHPGHFAAFRAYADLGLFDRKHRKLFDELLRPLIDFPEDRDFVILMVEAENKDGDIYRALLVDDGDADGTFTAMERTTGFPTAAIAHLQASGAIAAGAVPIERAVPLEKFLSAARLRGIEIKEEKTP